MTNKILIILLSLAMTLSIIALCACSVDSSDQGGSTDDYNDTDTDNNDTDGTVADTYTISFDGVATAQEQGATITTPTSTPTKDSTVDTVYTFDSWNTSPDGTGTTLAVGDKVVGNVAYYSQYTTAVREYSVEFDSLGGTSYGTISVPYGSTATQPSTNPTKSGYVFVCWLDATGAKYSFDTTITADATLTAKYYTDGLEYTLTSDGSGYIVADIGTADVDDIIIPDSYNGKSVVGIAEYAFEYIECTSVVVGCNVSYIDRYAFFGCTRLASIVVDSANTVYRSIDGNLYSQDATVLYLYALGKADTSFVLPDSVTVIYDSAFYYANNLTDIALNGNLQTIDAYAFAYSAIQNIVIPDNVINVNNHAFKNVSGNIFLEGSASSWYTSWDSEFEGTVYEAGSWQYVAGVPTPITNSDRA